MPRNIELKARLADLPAARQIAGRIATQYVGCERQVDTYFHVPQGRLKLREIDDRPTMLVYYRRPDSAEPKPSDYWLVPVASAAELKQALAAALGVRAVVDKRREIFLADNVRIHLDEVAGLGTFLEFEAVLSTEVDDAAGHAQVELLSRQFGLRPDDLIHGSYGEPIVLATERKRGSTNRG